MHSKTPEPCNLKKMNSRSDSRLVPGRRRSPVPEHVIDGSRPLMLKALRELVGFFLGGIATAPHLPLPGVDHGIARNEASAVQ